MPHDPLSLVAEIVFVVYQRRLLWLYTVLKHKTMMQRGLLSLYTVVKSSQVTTQNNDPERVTILVHCGEINTPCNTK